MRSLPLVGRVARLIADRRDGTRPALTLKGEAYSGLDAALDEPVRCSHCREDDSTGRLARGGMCRYCAISDDC